MSTIFIVMRVLGLCFIVISFLIKGEKDNKNINQSTTSSVNISDQKIELTEKQKDDIKSQVDALIEEQINSIDDRTEASLDRISNTKILEMNEYADTIMNEISRNHNETVFLYDMLNEKAKEVKGTVKDVNIATQQVKKIQSSTMGLAKENTNKKSINQDKKDNLNTKSEDYIEVVHIPDDEDKVKNNVIDIAQKDKAKTRLMELSKQSLAKEDDTKEKTKQNNQAGKLTDMMEAGKSLDNNLSKIINNENNDIKSHNSERQVTKNEKNEKILELHNMGFTPTEIAKNMGIGTGEVSLIIDLYGKNNK